MPELAEKADNESARLGAVRGGASVGSDLDSLPTLVAFASREEHLNFGLERVAEDDKVTGERAVGGEDGRQREIRRGALERVAAAKQKGAYRGRVTWRR